MIKALLIRASKALFAAAAICPQPYRQRLMDVSGRLVARALGLTR